MNTKYVVVDASLWVALLVEGDVFHAASKTWLEQKRTAGWRFLAPALLIVEVAAAISRPTGNPELAWRAADTLQRLPALRLVAMDHALVQTALAAAAGLGLRGADAFYVATARYLHVPLATLDADQRRRAARWVDVVNINT